LALMMSSKRHGGEQAIEVGDDGFDAGIGIEQLAHARSAARVRRPRRRRDLGEPVAILPDGNPASSARQRGGRRRSAAPGAIGAPRRAATPTRRRHDRRPSRGQRTGNDVYGGGTR
jgi:hypothetical protein